MTLTELERRIAPAKHLLGYFDQQALASYRNEPEKYVIETDSFEGTLTVTGPYYEELERCDRADEYLNFKFGYRSLADGDLAVVLWLPDLEKANKHQNKWLGFLLRNPVWTTDPDERFANWAMRYLEGSWDVDNGPRHYIAETMNTINGMTKELVGLPLFKHAIDASLGFPAAENTHRYQDAHKVLYGYLIDGIDKDCLAKLATRTANPSTFGSDRTTEALMKLLPALRAPSKFAEAAALVSEQRRAAAHSVRPKAERFSAFTAFTNDLTLCLEALNELLGALESLLGMVGTVARDRNEAKARLPHIVGPAHSFASIRLSSGMVGKTFLKVEYGVREDIEKVHGSECMHIHFTDGTILGVETGSNAWNIASSRSDLLPEEFRADFSLTWVPSLDAHENLHG